MITFQLSTSAAAQLVGNEKAEGHAYYAANGCAASGGTQEYDVHP
jgi:hypothetical protein